MDKLTPQKRSQNMSKIRAKNTKLELRVRRYLFSKGYRYRIHGKLPGKPDLVFGGKKIAVFVQGCFWHRHGCKLTYTPKSNVEFWQNKFEKNKQRDLIVRYELRQLGWYPFDLWECLLKSEFESSIDKLIAKLEKI
jgi:DNA mismatch endonuclease, patch repair protein